MDRHYKAHFLELVEATMGSLLPEFHRYKLPRTIEHRENFVGSLLYRKEVARAKVLWLVWQPGEGVERYFHIHLGWSPSPDRLPMSNAGLRDIHELKGPSAALAAGLIDLEQIEGKNAIAGIRIPTPWDPLLAVPPSAPKRVQAQAMRKAYLEAEALTVGERRETTSATVHETFHRLLRVLPAFQSDLEELPGAA